MTDKKEHPPVWRDAHALRVSGRAVADFLQGYLTCDTERLREHTLVPMALCNVKGRVVASGWAVRQDDTVVLIVHHTLSEAVATFLTPYAKFSRCHIASVAETLLLVGEQDSGNTIITFDSGTELGHQRFVSTDRADVGVDCSAQLTQQLIDNNFAFISSANSERFLPQMLGLDQAGAVDFDKGCYLGQEIVARAQFRGAVKRTLVSFTWHGAAPPIGEPWQDTIAVVATCEQIGADSAGTGLAVAQISSNT